MPSQPLVACRDLCFSYNSSSQPLLSNVTAHFARGFTGLIGANGAGKSTLLRLLMGDLTPTSGSVTGTVDAVYCEQRTDHAPDNFRTFLEDSTSEAYQLRGRLGVEDHFYDHWGSLSPGERKRAQIGHALWCNPSLLALDEPTNHIDAQARLLLLENLRRYRGVALIVSHDRVLLDALCNQCLWLEPPQVHSYPGGYSAARAQRQAERHIAVRERSKLQQENKKLQRAMANRRSQAAGEHKARSKEGLSSKDSDAREKINRARVNDGKAGNPLRQLAGRSAQAQVQLQEARVEKEFETGVWLSGSKSPRAALLTLSEGSLLLADGRRVQWPHVVIRPDERIAITGANGAGKSTFVRHVSGFLNVPQEKIVSLEQEIPADIACEVLAQVQKLAASQLGQIMNIVSRLNSRPERLLVSQQPSPGEIRKLILAVGMQSEPYIVIMDEPTNHLDLPSIEALEVALRACPCALLLVSHDQHFLEAVGATIWSMEVDSEGNSRLVVDG